MAQKTKYQEALDTGKTVLRKTWINHNAKSGIQISLQFQQKIKVDSEGTGNMLVAFAQDMSGIGENYPTVILSMKPEVAEKIGIPIDADLWDPGDVVGEDHSQVIFANDIFPAELRGNLDINIQVVENFSKNPLSPKQEPKKNPRTMAVLTKNGVPIYRHTYLVQGEPNNVFVAHDRVASPVTRVSTSFAGVGGEPQ